MLEYNKIYCILRRNVVKNNNSVEELRDEQEGYSDDSLFNITSFGTDLSFRELITMYDEGDLEKPELQRHYVWDKKEASRFIDSILLGLPVPSIFLAKTEDDRRLIVDGYQRIMTVYDYVNRGVFGGDGKSFDLSKSDVINQRWRGKTYKELTESEQRKIRNTPIHAIVFEQKEPRDDDSGMYQIFERINTSGRSLKPQEIRNCVNHGEFNKLLMELNENEIWRKIFSPNNSNIDSRMSDVELILRLFAFAYISKMEEINSNQINLVKYLNKFMKKNQSFNLISKEVCKNVFINLMNFFSKSFDSNLFRNGKKVNEKFIFATKINPAIFDSVCAATIFCFNKNGLEKYINKNLEDKYIQLLENGEYQEVISQRTTNIQNIKKRINLATSILYGLNYEW